MLTGTPPAGEPAARFARRGLAGIIAWPASEPVFEAILVGGQRGRWSPHVDARLDALAAGYALLIGDRRMSRRPQGGAHMRVAIYARVSTENQEARGTIGSQLEALHARASGEGHEIVAEFLDDGHSGARLDRPGLDALRDAAEAGLFETVWCLSPDRLARAYAYQVIVLDELARHGMRVLFSDAPAIDDDPQARLLTQVQGVIAEYERAKIAERYRRGKLYRSRAGEVISWKTPYGYRRVPRGPDGLARLVVFEPEAEIVRRIFDDYVAGGQSTRQIVKRLSDPAVISERSVALRVLVLLRAS